MDLTEYNKMLGMPLPIPGRDGISGKPYPSRYYIDRRYDKPKDFTEAVWQAYEELRSRHETYI